MAVVATQQWQHAEEHQRVKQHLTKQQCSMLDQLVASQAQMSEQFWDLMTQAVRQTLTGVITRGGSEGPGKPTIHIPKMTNADDPKVFLNSFKRSAKVAG